MKTTITIFSRQHLNNTDVWNKKQYSACVRDKFLGEVTPERNIPRRCLTIRIFNEDVIVNIGDVVVIGECEMSAPPAVSPIITAISYNNYDGSERVRHIKITAEG